MVFKEPRVEFVCLSMSDTIATSGAGYEICEKITGEPISETEWCATYSDKNVPMSVICAENTCDTSSAWESNQI